MAEISPISPDRAANSFSYNAASSGGDSFETNNRELLLVNHTNDAGSTVTLTFATTFSTKDGQTISDLTIDIGPGEQMLLGPWPPNWYGDPDDFVSVSYSSETDIELAVVDPQA